MTLTIFDLIWWNATTSTHSCVELPLFFFFLLLFLLLFPIGPSLSLSHFFWQSFNKKVGRNRKALAKQKVCGVHTVLSCFFSCFCTTVMWCTSCLSAPEEQF